MQTNKFIRFDHRFDQYVQNLKKQGIYVHPAIKLAIFAMNNGKLQYPGLIVTQKVQGQSNLVIVPVRLLLTAHKALQQQQLKTVSQQEFYREGPDRILITYLLFLYWKKQTQNIWYQMVNLFAKQIDILSFWQEQQLKSFKDQSIVKAATLQKDNFQNQWKKFQQLMDKRNDFFANKRNFFTRQNYKWIYIHAISRCFGSFMNSTYFTPFCEFFNHHCVDVSYSCVTKQQHDKDKQQTQQKQKVQFDKKFLKEEQQKSQTSSISSGNSIDYIEQGDFNYWQIQSYKIKWGGKISFDLKDKQTKQIQILEKQMLKLLDQKIIWNGWNFGFIGQIIQKVNIIKNQYMAGRKKFIPSKQEYQKIKTIILNYKNQASKFFRIMGFKYDLRAQNQQTLDNISTNSSNSLSVNNQSSNHLKTTEPPAKPYQYFRMQARKQAQFDPQEQIYFCYGRISNRTMLSRYGCCIQSNRYDHVWIGLPLKKILSPYPDLFDRVQQKGLAIKYKLKIRPNIWSYQLYLWFKMQKYELTRHDTNFIFYPSSTEKQVQIFQSMIPLLEEKLKQFQQYPNYNKLDDESIGYHEYFIRVYHWQKVKILQKNLQMIDFIVKKLKEMGQTNKFINPKDFKQNLFKKQLRGYWVILQKGLKF